MKHEVYALHVGDKMTTRCQFLYREASAEPLTISFYFWAVLGGPEPVLFDLGFGAEHAEARGVGAYSDPVELLRELGVSAEDVRTVVVSHLHWDHWSGFERFSNATFLLQRAEAEFWQSRARSQKLIMYSANAAALDQVGSLSAAGRIRLLDGEQQLWPGLRIVPLGGHTPGLQALAVTTAAGTVVLASDALHFYENYERRLPAQVTMDFPRALEAFEIIEGLATPNYVIAGHDSADCTRFSRVADGVFRVA